jgi:hypothetical protein
MPQEIASVCLRSTNRFEDTWMIIRGIVSLLISGSVRNAFRPGIRPDIRPDIKPDINVSLSIRWEPVLSPFSYD